ncbi:hypothetical protein OIDMADRAFT_16442, partial [Oidiodendron maius Zn]
MARYCSWGFSNPGPLSISADDRGLHVLEQKLLCLHEHELGRYIRSGLQLNAYDSNRANICPGGLPATFRHRRSALVRLICISPPKQGGAIFSPFSPCDSTALSIVLLFCSTRKFVV